MASAQSREVRRFYNVALQRFEDAEVLLRNRRTTGAIYLAGYAVECVLKALLLANIPRGRQRRFLQEFRGTRAHDFDWLRQQLQARGVQLPQTLRKEFTRVNTWSTDLRYNPGTTRYDRGEAFLTAAAAVIEWVKGRL